MTIRRTALLALTATTLIVTACNGTKSGTPVTSAIAVPTTVSDTTALPVTTVAPTTSTAPATVASPLETTTSAVATTTVVAGVGDDWPAIIQTLGTRRQALYADPDPSRIEEVCAGGSQCFEQLDVQLSDLQAKGWRIVGADPFTVLSATIEKFDGDTLDSSLLVTVIVTVQRPADGGAIIDDAGTEIATVESETEVDLNTESRAVLARLGPPADPWRIVSQDRIREVPG